MCAKYTTASNELVKAPVYLFTTTAASITMMAALTHHPPLLLLLLLPRSASQLHSTALCDWPPPATLLFLLSHCLCVFALSDVRLSSHPKQLPLILSAFFSLQSFNFLACSSWSAVTASASASVVVAAAAAAAATAWQLVDYWRPNLSPSHTQCATRSYGRFQLIF